MKKIPAVFAASVLIFLGIVSVVRAESFTISGNGSATNNSLNINSSTSTSVNQTNQGTATNDIDASANTGGNSGSAQTGGANVNVNVNNQFNSNTAETGCCGTPTPTKKPGTAGADDPGGQEQGGTGGQNGNGGSSSSSNGPTAGGEILGLSKTAGDGKDALWFYAAGGLLITIGGALAGTSRRNFV